jgi:hypothetical protein
MAKDKGFVTIDIASDGASATADPERYSRPFGTLATWKITGVKNLPGSAEVYIQFVDKQNGKARIDGPLFDGKKNRGKFKAKNSGNSFFIEDMVIGANSAFDYQVGYELGGVEQPPLLDPELVVEGTAPIVLQFLKARRAEAQAKRGGKPKAKKRPKPKAKKR